MQQILIIGLGQFGMSLARSLAGKGAEVIAIDRRRQLVEDIAPHVAEALVADATDEEVLVSLQPQRRDACVCAIGDDSKESSIICTALLRQLGAQRIIARAGNSVHKRILSLVGAHQVINPEQEFGERFANRLAYHQVISDMPLGDDLHLTEIKAPDSFLGKTLIDLALPKRYGIMVVAIRRGVPSRIIPPLATDPLQTGDTLVLVSPQSAIPKLLKGV